ncbi:MAG: transporter substrate-binding domain-containing protein, partial [Oscillochloris sp.]|nr:transporter substrate-binding domain-containing protein [Oscillochloris sp.]
MINRRILIAIGVLSALFLLGLTLVVLRDQSFDRIKRVDTIRIGYAVEAPFAFLAPGDVVTGESPEVARAVVQRLGITQITWVQTDFDQLIPELEEGRFDLIAAGMFITPDRAQRVAFSQPTFHVKQGLLVLVGNPYGLHS